MARINNLISQFIPYNNTWRSWLDIGTGNGLVAQEMRGFNSMPRKIAMDAGSFPEDVQEGMGHYLDASWEKIHENFTQNGKLWNETFDVVTLMDVIQYYPKPDATVLLDHLDEIVRHLIVIWTPDGLYPHPGHVSGWVADEFLDRGYSVYRAIGFHQGPPQVGNGLLAWKNPEWRKIYI